MKDVIEAQQKLQANSVAKIETNSPNKKQLKQEKELKSMDGHQKYLMNPENHGKLIDSNKLVGIEAQNLYLANYIHKLEFLLSQISNERRKERKDNNKKIRKILKKVAIAEAENNQGHAQSSMVSVSRQSKFLEQMISIS